MSTQMAPEGARTAAAIGVDPTRLLERIPWITSDGLALVRPGTSPRIVWANPALHALLGATPGALTALALAELPAVAVDLLHPAASSPKPIDVRALFEEGSEETICSLHRTDGSAVTVALTALPLEAQPHGVWVLTVREVAAQIWADALLHSSEERFRALADHAPIGVALSDVGVRLGYVNARLAEMWGQPIEVVRGDGWLTAVVAEDRGLLVDALVQVLAGEDRRLSIRVQRSHGATRWIDARLTPVSFVGHGAGFVASMEDVTEARDRESRLAWQATHDSLTGLPNRVALRTEVDERLERHLDEGMALLFFDLDDFKLVNDSLGHQMGDRLLQEVAERFRASVRVGDVVARLGGDEFVVLCHDVFDEAEALRVAGRLLEHLQQPLLVAGAELQVSASVGVVLAEAGVSGADELLRDADVAMYQAKNDGKSRTAIFDETHRWAMQSRLELITNLRAALTLGDVGLHYQPIVDLTSGEIIGAEALLRFHDPIHGPMPASEIVGLAEDTGCIVELGAVVLRLATQQLARWLEAGHGPRYVAVNLAARQFREPDLLEIVGDALARAGLRPDQLCLELTESHLMAEVEQARGNMRGLEALGVRLAIDDFGAGYSSLSYLRRIPAKTIKIDRSFIDGVDLDPDSAAIVGAITTMSRALGRTVVAEGVETAEQLTAVRHLGCDAVQGYLLSRPVEAAAFPRAVRFP